MGLGLALVACFLIFVVVGAMVFQGRSAAHAWRRAIRENNQDVLEQLLEMTFEGWRAARPPRGLPAADLRALHTAAVVAATPTHIRVSLLAEPDVRVVEGHRVESGSVQQVARRTAARMVERLMYEVPHVSFQHAQVDVLTEYRDATGVTQTGCVLSTRVTREAASWAAWEDGDHDAMLAEWETIEDEGGQVDPDRDALLAAHPDGRDDAEGGRKDGAG